MFYKDVVYTNLRFSTRSCPNHFVIEKKRKLFQELDFVRRDHVEKRNDAVELVGRDENAAIEISLHLVNAEVALRRENHVESRVTRAAYLARYLEVDMIGLVDESLGVYDLEL